MKKILVLLLTIIPLFVFSQRATPNETAINWISLKKAKEYAEKYNKNILIYFYKENCPYCEEMKKETLNDISVINLINSNFFPVKLNSRAKDTIYYKGKAYSNQQPVSDGSTWRHDFYAEVSKFKRQGEDMITTPTIVLFNNKFEKITLFPGKQPKVQLLRNIQRYLK
ncbi:thioredoxin fold domain-containing protein [Flavobacteriales bacterium]|nr:thioredoxin fold domain-containing protein [Flavobacteriales bacterium]